MVWLSDDAWNMVGIQEFLLMKILKLMIGGYVSYMLFPTSYFLIFFSGVWIIRLEEGDPFVYIEEGDIFIWFFHGPLSSLTMLTHSSPTLIKKADFCSAQPSVLDVDCSLSPTLRNSFDLEPTIMQMCTWDQLWSRQITSFPFHHLLPQLFLLSLYSRAGSLPNPLLDIYSKLKTEVIILFFNLVWLCE